MATAIKVKAGASLQFAQSLFTRGTDVFGPAEIEKVFGTKIPEDRVPPIPFSEVELQTARRLGQVLVFQPECPYAMVRMHDWRENKTSDGKPLLYNTDWYKLERFFTEDTLPFGWKLVSREVLPGSLGQNYLEQTGVLADHLNQVFGDDFPDDVQEAVAEFRPATQELAKLMTNDWQKAAERLANLKLNQLFRQTPAEVLWLLTLYEGINHERLLPNVWTWTNKRSSFGGLVNVGPFGERGVDVDNDGPGGSSSGLGVCFSRGGTLES